MTTTRKLKFAVATARSIDCFGGWPEYRHLQNRFSGQIVSIRLKKKGLIQFKKKKKNDNDRTKT